MTGHFGQPIENTNVSKIVFIQKNVVLVLKMNNEFNGHTVSKDKECCEILPLVSKVQKVTLADQF